MKIRPLIPEFIIREAIVEDAPLILSFIKGLGEYEKLSHEVVATEVLLRENLFGENPVAEVILGYYQKNLWLSRFSSTTSQPFLANRDCIWKTFL